MVLALRAVVARPFAIGAALTHQAVLAGVLVVVNALPVVGLAAIVFVIAVRAPGDPSFLRMLQAAVMSQLREAFAESIDFRLAACRMLAVAARQVTNQLPRTLARITGNHAGALHACRGRTGLTTGRFCVAGRSARLRFDAAALAKYTMQQTTCIRGSG